MDDLGEGKVTHSQQPVELQSGQGSHPWSSEYHSIKTLWVESPQAL